MDFVSGVKVEYTDPSDVYAIFADELLPRLPLRELHWSSSSRPTRSISSLKVELVSAEGIESKAPPTSIEDSSASQENGPPSKVEGPKKERRHQIPGLRRTPYLKIYLLYCNNIDTYRGSYRKQLREWVKEQSPPSQSNSSLSKQENHDAFEWLIIHVVPPATDVPIDPSRPSSNKGDGNVEKRPTSSRWPSRNSTSVIEKLKSDFNSTSKHAVDRVAQIQLKGPAEEGVRHVDLPIEDVKKGWDDLVFKLKSLILASFDLRVSQYEEDIREREGQKKVFGWNFNTFFVLKEGLAMGFENMGLLDDALTVYQELAFGLKAAIEEQQNGGSEQQTAHFVDFTEDLYDCFEHATDLTKDTVGKTLDNEERVVDPGALILNTERKPFRELILSNRISFLDFQCYVFARQICLSLRLANAVNKQLGSEKVSPPRIEPNEDGDHGDGVDFSKPSDYEPENLILLAEVAKSSADFLTTTAGALRDDVQNAIKQSEARRPEKGKADMFMHDQAIDNFVVSWLFSACQRILEVTSVRSLSAQLQPLFRQLSPKATDTATNGVDEQATESIVTVHRDGLPARTSSLPLQNSTKPSLSADEPSPPVSFLDAARLLAPGSPHPGAQDLAAERGDILVLQKRVLGDLGLRHGGWQGSLVDMQSTFRMGDDALEDVELNEDPAQNRSDTSSISPPAKVFKTTGLCNESLLSALYSSKNFYNKYESLTILALVHYVVGDRKKAAEAMTADLGVARFHSDDYLSAASYFRQLAPFYAKDNWSDLEITMLETYAQCLKHLNKTEEYVRISLKTLAKMINEPSRRPHKGTTECLNRLLSVSKTLDVEVTAPLSDYFDNIDLGRYIRHFTDRDGFELSLKLRSLLPIDIQAQSVRVRMISTEGEQRSELWLATEGPQNVKLGTGELIVKSNMMQLGWYALDKIQILSSNMRFMLDLSPSTEILLFPRKRDSTASSNLDTPTDQPRLLVWPRLENLNACVTHYECINLEQPKSIRVAFTSGWNNIIKCKLSLRAASAGLRLHTAEAEVLDGNTAISEKSQPGSINMSGFPAEATVSIRIPYSIETETRKVSVRALIEYSTTEQDHAFACNASLHTLLPLAINVQDSFKQALLVSKFTIGPSTPVPVRIIGCHLEGNGSFRVVSPALTNANLIVFPRQPLSLVSKIYQITENKHNYKSAHNKLTLKVDYRCLNEDIAAAVENVFLRALAATRFQKFSRILAPSLLAAFDQPSLAQDLEVIGICGDVLIRSFEEYAWDSTLVGLPPEIRGELGEWLRKWHEDNPRISLNAADVLSPQQHLTVPVGIPQMQVVHTAKLQRLTRSSTLGTDSSPVPVGQGLLMELSFYHTGAWDLTRAPSMVSLDLEFRYEVQADPDVWLVGGQRKGHGSAKEAEVKRFLLLLWPQKTGHLVLPSVEIQSLAPTHSEIGDQDVEARALISSELDYQSLGDAVLVVPDLISTTVSLDPSGSGGGWLVESRSRHP